jgi:glucose dehydrogenase
MGVQRLRSRYDVRLIALRFLWFLCLAGPSACGPDGAGRPSGATVAASQAAPRAGTPLLSSVVTPAEAPGQWIRPAGDLSSTRYSELEEITAERVGALTVKASFATGNAKGHEAAPLVVGSTMYLVTPYPNVLFAFDLAQPSVPVKWKFSPAPLPASQGVACCDVVNRGAAYADGVVVFNTLDNRTIAVDATTGIQRWATRLGDIRMGETMTMAPLIVKDKVLVGNSGGELGVRGWLTALNLGTGAIVWRAYSTGPDKDVLIGGRFKPFYPTDR